MKKKCHRSCSACLMGRVEKELVARSLQTHQNRRRRSHRIHRRRLQQRNGWSLPSKCLYCGMCVRANIADDSQCSLLSGVLPGGGVALARASQFLEAQKPESCTDSFNAGVSIIKQACLYPFNQILNNVGLTPEVVFSKLEEEKFDIVFDVRKKLTGSAAEIGLIDPTQVVVSALTNAASAAVMLLSTGCVITEE